jgi:hypothetical protein
MLLTFYGGISCLFVPLFVFDLPGRPASPIAWCLSWEKSIPKTSLSLSYPLLGSIFNEKTITVILRQIKFYLEFNF